MKKIYRLLFEKLKNMPLTAMVSVSYAVCSIIQGCIGFLTMALFTRILTEEQYGQKCIVVFGIV